jgi:hypothetical protein
MEVFNPQLTVQSFLSAIYETRNSRDSLVIAVSDFNALNLDNTKNKILGSNWIESIPEGKKYNLIVADLPLGMPKEKIKVGSIEINIRRNWCELAKTLQFLSDGGICVALVEPLAFGSSEGSRFEDALNTNGYYLTGIFNTPEGLLQSTNIRPVIVIITRGQANDIFIGEIESNGLAIQLAESFKSRINGNSLSNGQLIKQRGFKGFTNFKLEQQLSKLQTRYKEYETVRLGDITHEINTVQSGEKLEERTNALYIPMLGTTLVTHDIKQVRVKHHNVFQVVLSETVDNEYLSAFFQSELGKLVIKSLAVGNYIAKIRKSDLSDARIALPNFEEQKEIAYTQRRLSSLSEAITDFQAELALNPKSASAIKLQLESMLDQIGGLTDTDKVMGLTRSGESKTVEFKESFSLDVRTGTKEKYIELSALKTIVAFLNTDGGTLLIGVSDSGDILGIKNEVEKFHKSTDDKFLLHVKNLLKQRIGEQYYPFIDQKLINVQGANILMVECEESSSPCYLDGNDFFVRTNPATDKLEGPQLVAYVQNHFKA